MNLNFFKKILYSRLSYMILKPVDFDIYRYILVPILYPKIYKKYSSFHIKGKLATAKKLATSNKSLSRFGDGEIQWMLGNKHGSFEKNSPLLRKRLSEVILSNNTNLMVALPDAFRSISQFNHRAEKLWGRFMVKYAHLVLPYLNKDELYYDTSVVRPYIDYHDRKYAGIIFHTLKKVWNNKNVLIVEGNGTRLGVGNDLFNNAKNIVRIECPVNNAFELYNKIFDTIIHFLRNNRDHHYITLLSLGPTATVLSYDIYNEGYRAIDIGHIDLEYCWYLMKTRKPVNLSYKYVNETNGYKYPVIAVHSSKYLREIVYKIN